MQQSIKIVFHIYMKFKIFWATQEPKTALALGTASSNYTSNNPPHMQNQRLLVQFYAPNDGRCVAWNMLSFIEIWNKILIHCCILLDFLCKQFVMMVLPCRNPKCSFSSVNFHRICYIATKNCNITGEIFSWTINMMGSLRDLRTVNNAALVNGEMLPWIYHGHLNSLLQ
jgi:hypothetical protein